MEIGSDLRFGDEKLKKAYQELDAIQEKQLKQWLDRAFEDLEKNVFCGIQLPKRLIPKEYHQKYGPLTNPWKYNLPNAWSRLYTIKRDEVIILSIILEWMDHKDYEKRFNY